MPALPPVTTTVRPASDGSARGSHSVTRRRRPFRPGEALVVVDDLGDHEGEPLLGELGVEVGLFGERPQSRHLHAFAVRVGCGHAGGRLQAPHLLGELEAFREQVDEGGVDVVDALPDAGEFGERVLVRVGGHPLRLPGVGPAATGTHPRIAARSRFSAAIDSGRCACVHRAIDVQAMARTERRATAARRAGRRRCG